MEDDTADYAYLTVFDGITVVLLPWASQMRTTTQNRLWRRDLGFDRRRRLIAK